MTLTRDSAAPHGTLGATPNVEIGAWQARRRRNGADGLQCCLQRPMGVATVYRHMRPGLQSRWGGDAKHEIDPDTAAER